MNWKNYKDSLSSLSNKGKGDSFETLVKHFLSNDPLYATKLKEVWLLHEVPSSIHKKLKLPKQDQGIDLICETNNGDFWAVQAKYHQDETTSQTWRSLSTFTGLAFGVCKNITFGLVCTTAERFTKTLKDQDNIGFCSGEVWRNLSEEFFKTLGTNRKPKKLQAFKPYNHQKRAIKNAFQHFLKEKESRGKLVLPCGTGKSLTAFWIAEKLDAQKILVAVPSLSLVRQTLQVWLRESLAKGWDVNWITICSDKSVGKVHRDDLAVLTQDLGIPAITDPNIIAKWLRKKHTGKVIVFTTYQSGKAIADATKLAKRTFDLGIMDEAHKTVGSRDKAFAHLLFEKNIKIKKRVFMTATERRYTGSKDTIVSMDDYDIYGNTFQFMSFKEALEEDPPILSDYKIITVMVGDNEIAEMVKNGKYVKPLRGKWNKEVQADTFASLIALRKAVKKYKIKHALSFHSSIARAEAYQENQNIFSDQFPDYPKLENFFVSGKMPTSVRDRHLREFESSKRALISNARCLTEGVDVPDIDCVLFADPKKSTVDIVQAVGRALRKSEGKKFGYVIVPVVIEKEGQGFEDTKAFQSILMTLRALASNDERIIDYFRDRANKKRSSKRIEFILDEQLVEKISGKDFIQTIELKTWDKLAKLSWMPYEKAKLLVQELGIRSENQYRKKRKEGIFPADFPGQPWVIYPEFKSMGDFFGTDRVADQIRKETFYDYTTAKKTIQKEHPEIKEIQQYYDAWDNGVLKKNKFPKGIYNVYRDEFSSGDFFGTGIIADSKKGDQYFSFKKCVIEARKLAKKHNIKKQLDWIELSKNGNRPDEIPARPDQTFPKQWEGWIYFLGLNKFSRRHKWTYERTRKYIKSKVSNHSEWKRLVKSGALIPIGVPRSIDSAYIGEGWIDIENFFAND